LGLERSTGNDADQRRGSVSLLTSRELSVCELVAAGHTTRETAVRLYVSPKTVEFHLGRAYRKLGIINARLRAGERRWAVRGGVIAKDANGVGDDHLASRGVACR
jgi:DNA-binding CsgD family transcriptional regulator